MVIWIVDKKFVNQIKEWLLDNKKESVIEMVLFLKWIQISTV